MKNTKHTLDKKEQKISDTSVIGITAGGASFGSLFFPGSLVALGVGALVAYVLAKNLKG